MSLGEKGMKYPGWENNKDACLCVCVCVCVCVNMCTFIYVCVYGVGDVMGTGEFNHTLTDVRGIDFWMFCEHRSRSFGTDINPSIKATSPQGFNRANTLHPICVCKSMCVCFLGSTKVNPRYLLNHFSAHRGNA